MPVRIGPILNPQSAIRNRDDSFSVQPGLAYRTADISAGLFAENVSTWRISPEIRSTFRDLRISRKAPVERTPLHLVTRSQRWRSRGWVKTGTSDSYIGFDGALCLDHHHDHRLRVCRKKRNTGNRSVVLAARFLADCASNVCCDSPPTNHSGRSGGLA